MENENWDSKYPNLMKSLYQGTTKHKGLSDAINELDEINKELSITLLGNVLNNAKDLNESIIVDTM